MKSQDISVGDNYALAGYGHAELGSPFLTRVCVLSVAKGQARVLFDNGVETDVSTRKIIGSWVKHTNLVTERRTSAAAAKAGVRKAAVEIAAMLPPGTHLPHGFGGTVFPDGSYERKGELHVYQLRDLLAAAYEQGKRDARLTDAYTHLVDGE